MTYIQQLDQRRESSLYSLVWTECYQFILTELRTELWLAKRIFSMQVPTLADIKKYFFKKEKLWQHLRLQNLNIFWLFFFFFF